MDGKRILVTGFKPFKGIRINTSEVVVRELARRKGTEARVETSVLPVSFKRAPEILCSRIEKFDPSAVIMTGISWKAESVVLEKAALNIYHYRKRRDLMIDENGPAAYFSDLPLSRLEKRLLKADIPATISYSAGQYVCNYLFYRTAHFIRTLSKKIHFGFVHLPCIPEEASRHNRLHYQGMPVDTVLRAVEIILDELGKL